MSYHREQYEFTKAVARGKLETFEVLGGIINEQQDTILSLQAEIKRLKRENWNLKKTKRRK